MSNIDYSKFEKRQKRLQKMDQIELLSNLDFEGQINIRRDFLSGFSIITDNGFEFEVNSYKFESETSKIKTKKIAKIEHKEKFLLN
ncbi:MAG: hypothetical protein K6E99_01100 [Bacilli bacterium]|nr:hypothetical protein [Bacilli bacterium]